MKLTFITTRQLYHGGFSQSSPLNNVQLVKNAEMTGMLDRELSSPTEAREILGIR